MERERLFQREGLGMFLGSGSEMFRGLGKVLFQGLGEVLFQGLWEVLFQGSLTRSTYILTCSSLRWRHAAHNRLDLG